MPQFNPTNYPDVSAVNAGDRVSIWSGADARPAYEKRFRELTTAAMNALTTAQSEGLRVCYNTDVDEPFFWSDSAAAWLSLVDGLPV